MADRLAQHCLSLALRSRPPLTTQEPAARSIIMPHVRPPLAYMYPTQHSQTADRAAGRRRDDASLHLAASLASEKFTLPYLTSEPGQKLICGKRRGQGKNDRNEKTGPSQLSHDPHRHRKQAHTARKSSRHHSSSSAHVHPPTTRLAGVPTLSSLRRVAHSTSYHAHASGGVGGGSRLTRRRVRRPAPPPLPLPARRLRFAPT